MTKRSLRRAIALVIAFNVGALLFGLVLRFSGGSAQEYYETFKDLSPLILGITAAFLGYAFQQRLSFLLSLRQMWSKMVLAVNGAIQYTYYEAPEPEDYRAILLDMGTVIDEIRMAYKNIGEKKGQAGLYPFEPVKLIYNALEGLGESPADEESRKAVRRLVIAQWHIVRDAFLQEFDRAAPERTATERDLDAMQG